MNESTVNKLQVYIEENFTLDGTSRNLIRNILDYVAAQGQDQEETLDSLMDLMDGIGVEREELQGFL